MLSQSHVSSHPLASASRSHGAVQFFSPDTLEKSYVRYRDEHLHEQLRLYGSPALLSQVNDLRAMPLEGDVLVLNRVVFGGRGAQIAETARVHGKAMVYSVDDLLFDDEFARQNTYLRDFQQIEEGLLEAHGTAFWRASDNFVRAQQRMLLFCDCAIVSTQYLAERVRQHGKPAYVIRNAMSQEMARLSQAVRRDRSRTGGRVALGYLSGTATHNHDFGDIAPVLARIMHKHWNVYLIVVGPMQLPAVLEEFGPRVRRHPFVDWQALPGLIGDIDINLAPLDMLPLFNQAKSEIKWMEAGAVGVPTVASATAGYCDAVRSGETGLLVNTPEEWEAALEELITQPALRTRIGEAARRDVYARYTAEARSVETAAVFAEIAERYARPSTGPVPTLPPPLEEQPTPMIDRLKGGIKLGAIQMTRNWMLVASPHYWGRILHARDPQNRRSRR